MSQMNSNIANIKTTSKLKSNLTNESPKAMACAKIIFDL